MGIFNGVFGTLGGTLAEDLGETLGGIFGAALGGLGGAFGEAFGGGIASCFGATGIFLMDFDGLSLLIWVRPAGLNCCKTLSSTLFIVVNWLLALRFFLGYFLGFLVRLEEVLSELEFWHGGAWSTSGQKSLSDDVTFSFFWFCDVSISTLVNFSSLSTDDFADFFFCSLTGLDDPFEIFSFI